MAEQDFPWQVGDTATTVMLSPCVGGLVRTWTGSGAASQLWSVVEAEHLRSIQVTGVIGRTLREERRFREAALLAQDGNTLMVQSRFPSGVGVRWATVLEGGHIVAGVKGVAEQFSLAVLALAPCARRGEGGAVD